MSSGTDALRFALIAAGVGKGDTVITVPHTFIATTEAISQAGATIAFVDIDDRTYNMDPMKLREFLESHRGAPIKAVVPVHLYGQKCRLRRPAGSTPFAGFRAHYPPNPGKQQILTPSRLTQ